VDAEADRAQHPSPSSEAEAPAKQSDHGAEAETQSLVQKHGLLVPAAFLAAGSVLSGSIVFLLKGRAAHAASSASPPAEPSLAKPAEAPKSH
jgi:hypothetical protein